MFCHLETPAASMLCYAWKQQKTKKLGRQKFLHFSEIFNFFYFVNEFEGRWVSTLKIVTFINNGMSLAGKKLTGKWLDSIARPFDN